MILINGILNVFWGLGLTAIVVLGTFFIGIICAPITILPTILGLFEIIYAIKLLATPPQRIKPSMAIAIFEITCILAGNFLSLIVGILVLIVYNDPKVKDYFAHLDGMLVSVPQPATPIQPVKPEQNLKKTTPPKEVEDLGLIYEFKKAYNEFGLIFRAYRIFREVSRSTDPSYNVNACLELLSFFPREVSEKIWALAHLMLAGNLVLIETKKINTGDDNFGKALSHAELAAQVFERSRSSKEWSQLQKVLASIYALRADEKFEFFENAIFHGNLALEVLTKRKAPRDWAIIHWVLASVYALRADENREHLEKAIYHGNLALKIISKEKTPSEWATIHQVLAGAYSLRADENHEYFKKAIHHSELSLEVFDKGKNSELWAAVHGTIACAYALRVDESRDYIEKIIYHGNLALGVLDERKAIEGQEAIHRVLAIAYSRQANESNKYFEESIHHGNIALEVYDKADTPKEWAIIQQGLTMAYSARAAEKHNYFEETVIHGNLALEVYDKENTPTDWATIHQFLAGAYTLRADESHEYFEKAVYHANQALEVYNETEMPDEWAFIQQVLASVYALRVDIEPKLIEKVHYHCELAWRVFTRQENPKAWAETIKAFANAHIFLLDEKPDQLQKVESYIARAMEIFTRKEFPNDWAESKILLSIAYLNVIRSIRFSNPNQLDHFIDLILLCITDAEEIYSVQNYPLKWAELQSKRASAYMLRIKGNYSDNKETAKYHMEQALIYLSKQDSPKEWADAYETLSEIYSSRIRGDRSDNLERALSFIQTSAEIFSKEDFPKDWSELQIQFAEIYIKRINGKTSENYDKAIYHVNQALEVLKPEVNPTRWSRAMVMLVYSYMTLPMGSKPENNIDTSIGYFEQVLNVLTREKDPELWARVQELLAKALAERTTGNLLENYDSAIEHLQRSLEVYSRDGFPIVWAEIQNMLGNLHAELLNLQQGDHEEKATRHYQFALEILTSDQHPQGRQQTLMNIGLHCYNKKDWEEAFEYWNEAIGVEKMLYGEAYTETGRLTEVSSISSLYIYTAYCLSKLKRFDEGVLLLEQGMGRTLAENLILENITKRTDLPDEMKREIIQLRATVKQLEAMMRINVALQQPYRLQSTADTLQGARTKLKDIIQEYETVYGNKHRFGLEISEFLALIPQSGALVTFLMTSLGSLAYVIPHGCEEVSKEHILWLDKFTGNDLFQLFEGRESKPGWFSSYRARRYGGSLSDWMLSIEELTQEFWNTLMSPLYEKLVELGVQQGSEIVILPPRGLGLLPLHAAWRFVDGAKRAFIDDFTVTYAPNVLSLKVGHIRVQDLVNQEPSLLAVVNPTSDLAYSKVECDLIAKFFLPNNQVMLPGNDATKQAIMSEISSYNHLHFSCHGFYNWQDPMYSGLILANKEHLFLSDILSEVILEGVRLVTLSACETGIYEVSKAPDEFIGLPTGFIQAGASGVVSSLWRVEDLSTAILMQRFYRNLFEKNMPPGLALSKAQIWLRDLTLDDLGKISEPIERISEADYIRSMDELFEGAATYKPFAHPYYWAAFIFSGT